MTAMDRQCFLSLEKKIASRNISDKCLILWFRSLLRFESRSTASEGGSATYSLMTVFLKWILPKHFRLALWVQVVRYTSVKYSPIMKQSANQNVR